MNRCKNCDTKLMSTGKYYCHVDDDYVILCGNPEPKKESEK